MCNLGGGNVNTTGGTTSTTIDPNYKTAYESAGKQLGDYVNRPYQAYKGPMVAGTNPLIDEASRNTAALGPNANVAAGADLVKTGATRDFSGADAEKYMDPYRGVMKNAAISNYADTLPTLSSKATGVGGHGGSREALLEAKGRQGLEGTLAGIDSDAFKNAQTQFNTQNLNLLKGGAELGNLGNTQFTEATNAANNQYNMGAGLRSIDQDQLNANRQAYEDMMNYVPNKLQTASGIVGQSGARGTQVQNTAGGPNVVGQGLAALNLLNSKDSSGNSFYSDLKDWWNG